jgi:hypothetical protein
LPVNRKLFITNNNNLYLKEGESAGKDSINGNFDNPITVSTCMNTKRCSSPRTHSTLPAMPDLNPTEERRGRLEV